MIKPFSDSFLKTMKILFIFSFSRKIVIRHIENYSTQIKNSVAEFENSINKLGFTKGPEFSRISSLYFSAVLFRNNKKLVKSLIKNFLAIPIIIGVIVFPFLTTSIFTNCHLEFWSFIIIYSSSFFGTLFIANFTINCIEFIKNFEVKIGKVLTRFIIFSLLLGQCAIFLSIKNLDDGLLKAVLFSIYFLLLLLIIIKVILFFFSELLVDAFYFSKKIQITEALIIESSYQLSKSNWKQNVKIRLKRQNSLNEIERLAKLVESDWNNHILSGDEKTNNWKSKTLQGISSGIRNHKRELIISSENSHIILTETFNAIFDKILKNNIQGLVGHEVPAARIHKKSVIKSIQSFLVAIIPISIVIILKFFPINEIDENYIHIALGVASFWFLLSLLLWLDPNLSDKIATIKSFKSVFKNQSED